MRIGPLIVGGVAFVAYLRTLLPGVAFGDWGEMQTVPHVLGVAHPTGYPTYILLAWLVELVPVGSVALRANILSAALVAIALATTTAIALRLGARPTVAIATGLGLGAIGTVWAAATVAEVNPLHLALVALLIHRALVWEETRRRRDLALGGLLVGLALGNHLLTLFVAPFIVAFALWAGRRTILDRPDILAAAAGAGILGLLVYLYIPIAASLSPVLPYNHPTTVDAVWWLVSGTQFRGQFDFLSGKGPGELVAALPALWTIASDRATVLVPVLGIAGLLILARRRAALALALGGILVVGVYLWANYLRLEHYLLVPWLVLAIGAAVALESLAGIVDARLRPLRDVEPGDLISLVAAAAAVALAIANWSTADRSRDASGERYLAAVFGALPENAAILSEWDASTPLWHGQHVRGERPDVLIVDDTNIVYEGWRTREARIASLICERPVFMVRLSDADLEPTRALYDVSPFLAVRIAAGGPTAVIDREVFHVTPRPGTCPA